MAKPLEIIFRRNLGESGAVDYRYPRINWIPLNGGCCWEAGLSDRLEKGGPARTALMRLRGERNLLGDWTIDCGVSHLCTEQSYVSPCVLGAE